MGSWQQFFKVPQVVPKYKGPRKIIENFTLGQFFNLSTTDIWGLRILGSEGQCCRLDSQQSRGPLATDTVAFLQVRTTPLDHM